MWKMGIFLIFTSKTPGFFRAILYHSLPPPLLLLVLQWEVRSKVTFQHLWTLTGCVSQKSETQAVKVGSWRPLFTGVCLYFYIYIYVFILYIPGLAGFFETINSNHELHWSPWTDFWIYLPWLWCSAIAPFLFYSAASRIAWFSCNHVNKLIHMSLSRQFISFFTAVPYNAKVLQDWSSIKSITT